MGADPQDAGPDFEVVSCHSIRNGFAAISLRAPATGVTIVLEKMPFVHDYAESQPERCRRIQREAGEILRRAGQALCEGLTAPAEPEPDWG